MTFVDPTAWPWRVPPIPGPPGSVPITFDTPNGPRTFKSGAAAARVLGVSEETIRRRRRRGERKAPRPSGGRTGRPPVPVTVGGLDFPSMTAAARFFGVTPQAISSKVRNIAAGRVRSGKPPVPVTVGDRTFPSQGAAAKFFGVAEQTISAARKRGRFRGEAVS